MPSSAIVTQGTKLFRGTGTSLDDSSNTWERVRGVSSFSGPNTSKAKIDVTSFDSARKEYVYGLQDDGDISFTMYLYPGDTTHKKIVKEDIPAAYNRPWRLELSDGTIYEFEGNVSGAPLSGNMDAAVTWNVTITVSGTANWQFASDVGELTYENSLVGDIDDGSVDESLVVTLTSVNETVRKFVSLGSSVTTFTRNTHYKVDGLPSSLTPVLTRTSDSVVTLTITGSVADTSPIDGVKITFLDAIFDGFTAIDVKGTTKDQISILFV